MQGGTIARKHIQVRGVVQGVGFRPFVYNLAESLSLAGHVYNSSSGVTIEVEGDPAALGRFLDALSREPPPLAEVADIRVSELTPQGELHFSILHSHQEKDEFALISPDTGTCDACWRDITDPSNRRFGYPFTNCTDCGPRYSIVRDIPYDRPNTTMAAFRMCPECAKEYGDPRNRRFHAQPNACPECGPGLALLRAGEELSAAKFNARESLETLQRTRALLREGRIFGIKGLGGFLLACDAGNQEAVAELRKRKRRPDKPLAIMARDLNAVRELCHVSTAAEKALVHLRRPIVILRRQDDAPLALGIATHNNSIGVMLPYTPLHYLLFSDVPEQAPAFPALVMTSGNFSEEPIITSNEEAVQRLGTIADWFLLHNRDIAMRVDDSVVQVFDEGERVMRRARGYAPQTVDLGKELTSVLGFGAELKNTFCLTKGRYAILSQHIGDLENYETEEFFKETLERMQHLFRVQPRALAHDLHPGYRSTRMALASEIEPKFAVQHHHAHIASCMAENHLSGDVIGVAFDGTGFGTDGKIWGGEFLIANLSAFTRYAHLRYVPLPGGDAAVRQPWRSAVSYLRDAFGTNIPDHLGFVRSVSPTEFKLVNTMLEKNVQTVETSSAGRLFDAVAAMVGLPTEVSFEGQAAIALESQASDEITAGYSFDLDGPDPVALDLRAMVIAIVEDLRTGRSVQEISSRFHNTLSMAIAEVCYRMRASSGLGRVCLSGGTFQNLYLLRRTVVELRRRGFEVYLHATVPANDGGTSLGQAVIANELLNRGA